MAIKCTKWSYNLPTYSILRPSKIYQNWDFWFENVPFGNPGLNCKLMPRKDSATKKLVITKNL
jgi:hypothetical protein